MILLLSEGLSVIMIRRIVVKGNYSISTYLGHRSDMALSLLVIQVSDFLVFVSPFERPSIWPFQMSFHLDHSLV